MVDFLIAKDKHKALYYSSLQSDRAIRFLAQFKYNAKDLDTIVFYRNGKLYKRSTAVLHIFKLLGFPWSLFFILIVIPPFIRDFIYRIVAGKRYQWFEKREACRLPAEEERSRFF